MSIVIARRLTILIVGVGLNALVTGCNTDKVRNSASVGCRIGLGAIVAFTIEVQSVL